MNLYELSEAVKLWAHERNIINGSDPKTQALKFISEAGELASNLHDECKDDIGDCVVVLIVIAAQNKYDFNQTINSSSKEILSIPNEPAKDQYIKMMKEIGLFVDMIIKNQDCRDVMSSILAMLISIADRKAYGIEKCLQSAFDEIKERNGIMYNGTFIKSTDPRFESARAEVHYLYKL